MAYAPDATFDTEVVHDEDSTGPDRWYWHVSRAAETSASRLVIILLVALFLVAYFWQNIFITIGPGDVGVLYLRFGGGTQTDRVLDEGMKMIAPWDRLYIYDTRVQEVKHTMPVLTTEGLQVTLNLSIRYHPETALVGLLHEKVGPDYRDKIVIPEVESAMRVTMGRFPMSAVYGSQRALVQQAVNESLDEVEQRYVKVDQVIIRQVTLPAAVQKTIDDKMTQEEMAESYAYRIDQAKQEAARLQVQANGLKAYNDTLNSSLTPNVLKYEGIEATKALANSPNAKTIIVGSPGSSGLPIILGGGSGQ